MKPPEFVEPGPFAALHEQWNDTYPDRDRTIEQRLRETYRDAWVGGDAHERESILYFLQDAKLFEGAIWVVDGLGSSEYRVASLAAILVGVWRRLYDVDFKTDLRTPFLYLLHRCPGESNSRWAALGLEEGRLAWPVERSFIRQYEEWMSHDFPRDPEVERELLSRCRDVWRDGDYIDRAFVLNFLQVGHDEYAPDLILEGLKSGDAGLAHTAIFSADCAIRAGVDLGPKTKELIEAYAARFPENWGSAKGAWLDLGWRDGWLTRPPDDEE